MEQPVHFYNHQGEKLTGTLHLPDRPSARGVVFGHCFTCSRHTGILRHICTGLEAEAFMCLRFDFSGNGRSQGRFDESTYSKQIREMEMAAEFIAKQGALWIGLAGHSMGAVIALLAAARMNAIKAVCSLAGRLSGLDATHFFSRSQRKQLHDTGRVSFSSRGRSLQLSTGFFADAGQYNLPETIANLKTPLLVVHGDQDEIIPVQDAYLAQKLNRENTTLAVFPGADHMFSGEKDHRQVSQRVVKWFKKHAPEKRKNTDGQ
jgi:uncharacterized protein